MSEAASCDSDTVLIGLVCVPTPPLGGLTADRYGVFCFSCTYFNYVCFYCCFFFFFFFLFLSFFRFLGEVKHRDCDSSVIHCVIHCPCIRLYILKITVEPRELEHRWLVYHG